MARIKKIKAMRKAGNTLVIDPINLELGELTRNKTWLSEE